MYEGVCMSKLEDMLKYVSEHNDFYKKRINEYKIKNPLDITQWPVLTREELQENRYNIFSDGYKDKFFNQQLHRQSSSGSSGMPINVYWDKKDWYASNMSMWRRRLKYNNIFPNDKYVIFTLNASGRKSTDGLALYINNPPNVLIINAGLFFEKNNDSILVNAISDFNPTWLYIQPFILNKLMESYADHNVTPPSNLRYIESVGEILPKETRRKAKEVFGINVTNFYGSEEFNGIAYETESHKLEVIDENVFVEILSGDSISASGQGDAIITSLNNHAFPLIRYNQQDVISMHKSGNGVNGKNYIHNIVGRSYNTIDVNHIVIGSFMLTEIVGEINKRFGDPIREYKFYYHKNDKILYCDIIVAPRFEMWGSEVNGCLEKMLEEKLEGGNILIKVNTVSSISNNGKKNSILEIN